VSRQARQPPKRWLTKNFCHLKNDFAKEQNLTNQPEQNLPKPSTKEITLILET